MRFRLDIPTARGPVLNGVLFRAQKERKTDTVMIAITGIHGNFYSNPFYNNIGETLNKNGIDFVYAQTNDAFSKMRTYNVNTGQEVTIGSYNERFAFTLDDISSYLNFSQEERYGHIILAGHSLGANKVIHYLSETDDPRVEHFFLLSPANLDHMMSYVTDEEKELILNQVELGLGNRMLPFPFMGWVECIVDTAYDWQFSGILNNVHTHKKADFTQVEKINKPGAMLVGTLDNFTDGDPVEFLKNINSHMPTAERNKLHFIKDTGHTYQMKNQEVADVITKQILNWSK